MESNPQCSIHNKPLKQGTNGRWFCPTPITKSADGTKVLEWCKFKIEDTVEVIPEAPTTPLKQPEDDKARGMVRHGVSIAFIGHVGPIELTPEIVGVIEGWVNYIMTGEVVPLTEDLSEKEVDEISEKIKNQEPREIFD